MAARVKINKPKIITPTKASQRVATGGNYFSSPKLDKKFVRSGCTTLDLALGGGWVRRRIANVVGDKSTGKTLLMIEASANFAIEIPKAKIRYREGESAFDLPYAKALGMPTDRVDFGDPVETVEDLFEDLQKIIEGAKGPELVIVDSLDSLSDRTEMDSTIDAASYGTQKAKLMSRLFRQLATPMEQKDVTLIIVSQVRDKIGAMFGRKTTRAGGRARDLYASQVVYLAHLGTLFRTIKGSKRTTGVKIKAKIDKNKVSLPYRESEFSIFFGYGINDAQSCIDYLQAAKAMKGMGINADDAKAYLDVLLEDMTAEEADVEMTRLRDRVTELWYESEAEIMPKRSKYGS